MKTLKNPRYQTLPNVQTAQTGQPLFVPGCFYMENQEEIWKDVKGFEGYYQISNLYQVKSLDNIFISKDNKIHKVKGRILKPILKSTGYYFFNLCVKGERHMKDLHRIVAESFIENPLNKKEVNHVRGNKQDNRASVLEWATRSENAKHAFDNGLMKQPILFGENNGRSRISESVVCEIRELFKQGNITKKEIANRYNIDHSNVCKIINRKAWIHV